MTRPYHRRAYLRRADNEPPEHPERATSRRCLKCRTPFESAWAGERVCPKCKTRRDWREGDSTDTASWRR